MSCLNPPNATGSLLLCKSYGIPYSSAAGLPGYLEWRTYEYTPPPPSSRVTYTSDHDASLPGSPHAGGVFNVHLQESTTKVAFCCDRIAIHPAPPGVVRSPSCNLRLFSRRQHKRPATSISSPLARWVVRCFPFDHPSHAFGCVVETPSSKRQGRHRRRTCFTVLRRHRRVVLA